jgi:hypothetical protein
MTLIVGGTTVHTSASTEVRRKGDVQTLSVLRTRHDAARGRRPQAGLVRSSARMIQIKDDTVGLPVRDPGIDGRLKGTCPAVTFGVNGFSIVADGSTAFSARVQQLQIRRQGPVKGVVQSGGTVKATSVTK